MSTVFSEIKNSVSMIQVAEHLGFKINRAGFILSPFTSEKTPSCKLYKNSFYDFATNTGGDLIRFTALYLNLNNWEACRYLVDAFSLPLCLSGQKDNSAEIETRRRHRQREAEKEHNFKTARLTEIERLKSLEIGYKSIIENKIFSPLSTSQALILSELQNIAYKLDILCGIIGSRADTEELLEKEGYIL